VNCSEGTKREEN
jgi:hypothetical protein